MKNTKEQRAQRELEIEKEINDLEERLQKMFDNKELAIIHEFKNEENLIQFTIDPDYQNYLLGFINGKYEGSYPSLIDILLSGMYCDF